MKTATITLAGPIGRFMYRGQPIIGVQLVDVIAMIYQAGQFDTLIIDFETPGGSVSVGNKIYDYLMADKKTKGYKVVFNQTGMIASIGTKIITAGDEVIALDDGTENWFIHNPRTLQVEGDANALQSEVNVLRDMEAILRKDYAKHTGLEDSVLKELMDSQTGFTGARAVELKFATSSRKALNIAAYMNPKDKAVELLEGLVAFLKNEKKHVSLVLELEGGQKMFVETEDPSKLEGVKAFTVDANNAPTQVSVVDGTYTLAQDKRKVTVAGGVVSKVEAAPNQPATPPVTPPATPPSDQVSVKMDEIIALLKPGTLGAMIKKEAAEIVAAEITKLRSEIKTGHVPPTGQNFDTATKEELAKEWDRSFKANEHVAMKRNNPEQWTKLYVAKFGKQPNPIK